MQITLLRPFPGTDRSVREAALFMKRIIVEIAPEIMISLLYVGNENDLHLPPTVPMPVQTVNNVFATSRVNLSYVHNLHRGIRFSKSLFSIRVDNADEIHGTREKNR